MTQSVFEAAGHKVLPPPSEAEQALNPIFGPLSCRDADDSYFRRCLGLLQSMKRNDKQIISRLREFQKYARDPELIRDIQAAIETREAAMNKKAQKGTK